jgi:hypothetical protein
MIRKRNRISLFTYAFIVLSLFLQSNMVLVCQVTKTASDTQSYITFQKNFDNFSLSEKGTSAAIYFDSKDFPGVIRAVKDLQTDIEKVTNAKPKLITDENPNVKNVLIIGTLGRNTIIDRLANENKIAAEKIRGKWESFLIQVVDNPFPNVEHALIIVGSDKRGTIYGIYDLSEHIGVSPWYWWADVPVNHKDALFVKPGKYTQGPSVKYRGIFLNDEAPALTNWVGEKFGFVKPSINPPIGEGVANYGHEFYSKIFELLLRLKANYLWPAMWNNAFNEDDSENPRLADEYGIVMGTSHQEPMLRAQQEWDRRYYGSLGHWNYYKHPDTLENFWREGIRRNKNYESIITMGLRGANDTEIAGDMKANIAMVESIVSKQQNIIMEEMNPDVTKVPQSWCLYKEIMEYYNEGMRVPDNITLLWSDDNWGNIRRLPNMEERKRSGGAGVYYHFDYHGDPRSYQWLNTNPIAKIWDQMTLAKQYGADRIWIVNVGHFKGYEFPLEYFMNLAWNTDLWNNSNINEYTRLWAAREFGSECSEEIASIISKYTKFNGRRKPESLSPKTYSLVNYNEAEKIVTDYNAISVQAEEIYKKLSLEKRDAFYQLVLFPTKACALVNELYVTAGKNDLYSHQRRASTNDKVRDLFKADTTLMSYFNRDFANGKWNHFMDQTHLGYIDWSDPKTNNLNAIKLTEIQVPDSALLGVSIEGSELSWPNSGVKAVLPDFDIFSNSQHYIEIFNKGKVSFEYTITANVPWLTFSSCNGMLNNNDKRILIGLDESKLPKGKTEGIIKIAGTEKEVLVKVNAFNPTEIKNEKPKAFVESAGVISIEAEHYSKNIEQGDRKWIKVEDYGLTLSGMRATAPANVPAATPGKDAPCLEYPIYLFSKDSIQVTLVTSPLLNFMPGRDIRVAVSFDDDKPQFITNVPDKFKVHWSNPGWAQTVVNQARYCKATFNVTKSGYHMLKVWMIDPGVIVEKIILNAGGLKPSYLGPPESYNGMLN